MGCFKKLGSNLWEASKSVTSGGLTDVLDHKPANYATTKLFGDMVGLDDNTINMLTQVSDIAALTYGAWAAAPAVAGATGASTATGAEGVTGATAAAEGAASSPTISTGISELAAGSSSAPSTITGTSELATLAPQSSYALGGGALNSANTGLGSGALSLAEEGATYAIPADIAADMSAAGLSSVSEAPSLAPLDSFNIANPANQSATTYGAQTTPGGWNSVIDNPVVNKITSNPKTSAQIGMNLLNAINKAQMTSQYNKAQQKAWQEYMNSLNPPESVKAARYNTLADKAVTQSNLSKRMLENNMAARGIRGKGATVPSGDLAEATRASLSDAYNQIYGTYNVPNSSGPVNYSPSAMNYIAGDATASANYLMPLLSMLSKYNVPATV